MKAISSWFPCILLWFLVGCDRPPVTRVDPVPAAPIAVPPAEVDRVAVIREVLDRCRPVAVEPMSASELVSHLQRLEKIVEGYRQDLEHGRSEIAEIRRDTAEREMEFWRLEAFKRWDHLITYRDQRLVPMGRYLATDGDKAALAEVVQEMRTFLPDGRFVLPGDSVAMLRRASQRHAQAVARHSASNAWVQAELSVLRAAGFGRAPVPVRTVGNGLKSPSPDASAEEASRVAFLRERLAESPAARYELGLRHLEGRGVPLEEGTGWGYIRSAADAGHAEAVAKLRTRP